VPGALSTVTPFLACKPASWSHLSLNTNGSSKKDAVGKFFLSKGPGSVMDYDKDLLSKSIPADALVS